MTSFFQRHKDEAITAWIKRRRREDYEWWRDLSPASEEHLEGITHRIALSLDRSASYVLRRFQAVWALERLPKLKAALLKHWHLDMDRLIAIGQKVLHLESTEAIDEALTSFLSPDSAVPSARTVYDFLRVKLTPHTWQPPEDSIQVRDVDEERSCLEVLTTHATAELMMARIRDLAKEWECSTHEALWQALLGKQAKVVVNVYQHEGSETMRTVKGGAIPATLEARTRILDHTQEAQGYRFPDRIRQYVIARDGHCRYPGCSVPAHACDVDHVMEYERGGRTSADNAQLLCRRHHNLKTEKKVSCTMDKKGVVTWHIFGATATTKPDGVITRTA